MESNQGVVTDPIENMKSFFSELLSTYFTKLEYTIDDINERITRLEKESTKDNKSVGDKSDRSGDSSFRKSLSDARSDEVKKKAAADNQNNNEDVDAQKTIEHKEKVTPQTNRNNPTGVNTAMYTKWQKDDAIFNIIDEDENYSTDTKQRRRERRKKKSKRQSKYSRHRSSSGSSSSDSTSDEDDTISLLRQAMANNRRRSMLTELGAMVKKKSSKEKLVQVFKAEPRHEIALTKLNVPSVLKFFDDIILYQQKHEIILKAATLVSQWVRSQVIAKNPTLLHSHEEFLKMNLKQLLHVLRLTIRPEHQIAFSRSLEDSVKMWVPDNFELNVTNFRDFYARLLVYRREFTDVYEFLANGSPTSIIPRVDTKPGGLVKIFISKIPESYGERVLQTLQSTKFNSLDDFLDQFYAKAAEHDHAAKYAWTLSLFTKKSVASTTKKAFTDAKTTGVFQRETKVNNRSLNHRSPIINNIDVYGEDSNIEEYKEERDEEEDLIMQDQDDNTEIEYNHKKMSDIGEENETFNTDADLDIVNNLMGRQQPGIQQRSSSNHSRPTSNFTAGSNGCYRMLFDGKCEVAKCTFQHDTATLRALAEVLQAKLVNRQRDLNDKYSITKAAVPTRIPPRPPALSDKNVIIKNDNTAFNNVLSNLLMYIAPETSILKAVYKEANVKLDDGSVRMQTLFDSGALHSSYIDKSFIDKHRNALKGRIKKISGATLLADKKTIIKFNETCTLDLRFISSDGLKHYIKETFVIMPSLSTTAIIGLPTIIRKLLFVFVDMLHNFETLNFLCEPWSVEEKEAIEDIETPLPCAFPEVLHYMELSHEEATQEYFQLFDEHVNKEFRDATDIVNLLKTKGLRAFVPTSWEGIKGIAPIEFNWKEGFPAFRKPKARPVNPKLFEHAHVEFNRLLNYMYQPSDSPTASCLVIAPKATKPFIRFCGDYATYVNDFILSGHPPIPHVFHSIQKICKFKIFLDIDLANSFHQFRLGPITSARLSLQTPWGQVQPMFLPEGVPPASGILQKAMEEIFKGMEEYTIVIFDNLLVLAYDFDDAYQKFNNVLDRCIERNLVLKFSKTWLGFANCEFFGYLCKFMSYELTQKRKDSIMNMPFPTSVKSMQRFLGTSLFFRQFVPHFSTLTAILNDMVKKDFNWNPATWTKDYKIAFENFKVALMESTALFYPDYELKWILRVDASDFAVAYVLLQIYINDSQDEIHQPLLFGSKKFSEQAQRWSIYDKEAYAIYFGVKDCEYWLRGKPFQLDSDHGNLQWMEKSIVPRVVRWRIYLQGFQFAFNHIAGKQNVVADWQSRFNYLETVNDSNEYDAFNDDLYFLSAAVDASRDIKTSTSLLTQNDMISQCHGSRAGHHGFRRTWNLLKDKFPGHGISSEFIREYIASCAVCQKVRLGMQDALIPIVRHLKNDGPRKVVGVDYLSLELDKNNNNGLYVIRDHFTKHIGLYPVPNADAQNLAYSLFKYATSFGVFDILMSDPGSDMTSNAVALLNKWFGIHHRISLVDRHESNGVEGGNKQILRHLRALICDERIKDRWSDPSNICWVNYLINKFDSSETGIEPYRLIFGTESSRYFNFPVEDLNVTNAPKFLKQLDQDLQQLHERSRRFQQELVKERTQQNKAQNCFQRGDFVLFQHPKDKPLPSKLGTPYSGPYEVIHQHKNDVHCRNIVLGTEKTFYVGDLKLFYGTNEEAYQLAMQDNDQHEVSCFLAYRGDPMIRTTMEFLVLFKDNTKLWLPWSNDLFSTVQYETFCSSVPALFPLLYRLEEARKIIAEIRKAPITEVQPGTMVYVDIRCYGATWYSKLALPDGDRMTYVVPYQYVAWKRKPYTMEVTCTTFNESFTVDNLFVKQYGTSFHFDPKTMILIDAEVISKYPRILHN